MNPLKSEEYPAVYSDYIDHVIGDVMDELREQVNSFPEFISSISEEKGSYAYAPEKWSIKEVIGHILDTERVMAYRAMRFSRNDITELAPFEQDLFVENSRHNERSFESMMQEFIHLRKANMYMFENLNELELTRKGMASGRLVSVKAFVYVIAGHLTHHRIILQERYLATEHDENLD